MSLMIQWIEIEDMFQIYLNKFDLIVNGDKFIKKNFFKIGNL